MNRRSVVNTLLMLNIVAFLLEMLFKVNNTFGLYFFLSPHFHWYQPVTYMFMHGGFMHIFFNMFALWMFGRSIEYAWGQKRFLIYYLVCGIGAAIVQEAGQVMGLIPPYAMTVGASGAVYGVLLAFGLTFPNERLFIIPIPIPIKAKWFVIGYAVIELLEGMNQSDGVAHFAHLGGMLFGLLLFLYWKAQSEGKSKPIRVRTIKVSYDNKSYNKDERSGHTTAESETPHRSAADTREIDRILDKIRNGGYSSLTEEEKQTLFAASKNG